LDSGEVGIRECDSDFEHFVKECLEAKGYEVFCQIGVAGFRIDLGVKHPKWPHGFLLGIECDGATYHSSLSARDRDRLRQQVLESLGWTIYRVWSTDWFLDQNREINKMVSFIESTLKVATGNLVEAYPDQERGGSSEDVARFKGDTEKLGISNS
jgi:very-short-patch-repair endonuclease